MFIHSCTFMHRYIRCRRFSLDVKFQPIAQRTSTLMAGIAAALRVPEDRFKIYYRAFYECTVWLKTYHNTHHASQYVSKSKQNPEPVVYSIYTNDLSLSINLVEDFRTEEVKFQLSIQNLGSSTWLRRSRLWLKFVSEAQLFQDMRSHHIWA